MIPHRTGAYCPREGDVLDWVAIGQWPERADPALVEHVDSCRSCRSLVVAASTVTHLRDLTAVPVRDASFVWHRAQVRVRQEANERALVPMNVVVGVSAASAAGLATTWWATGSPYVGSLWRAATAGGLEVAAALGSIPESAARVLASGAAQTVAGLIPAVAIGLGVGLIVVSLAFVVAKVADR